MHLCIRGFQDQAVLHRHRPHAMVTVCYTYIILYTSPGILASDSPKLMYRQVAAVLLGGIHLQHLQSDLSRPMMKT